MFIVFNAFLSKLAIFMDNSKLIELLKSFSSIEMKQFSNYVSKNAEKKDTLPYKLLLLLEKQYPEFNEKFIKKEKIYNKVFSDKKYNENKLSKLMTELTKIIEDYVVYTKQRESIADEKMILLKFYFERNLDKYFIATSRELKQILDDLPFGTYQNLMKYQHEELIATYHSKINTRVGNYVEVYRELNEFIEAEKLRWENISFIEPFPIEQKDINKRAFYIIHHLINQLLKNDDESCFFEAMLIIENNLHKFAQEESRDILKLLLFFSIKKVNSGFVAYYEQQLRIYHIFIKLNLILNQYGKISAATYKNYINASLKTNKIKEAELFLENYKDFLIDEIKDETYNFNKACLYFEKKMYSEVIDTLLNTKQNDIYYNIAQRRLLLKTYYEMMLKNNSYYNVLLSNMDTFKKFITIKNTIPDAHVIINKSFLKVLNRLLYINSKKEALTMYEEFKNTTNVLERQWIEEKIKNWMDQ